MAYFPCVYLDGYVELTDEREYHIAKRHPDLLPDHRQYIADTVANPDQARRSSRVGNVRLFSRWFDFLRGGKYVVVVVASDPPPASRNWIITAYIARKLATGGDIEWEPT